MAVYGNIGSFDENVESFEDYADRMDAFLLANEIHADRQASLFLASVGPSAYKLLKNLCSPAQPSTKSYAQLKQLLAEHFKPTPIVIAERHKFWTAQQGERESVADFVVRLKYLASTCSFGAFLPEALRDRLVSGLHSKMSRVQRQLLAIRELTFADARAKCIAEEMAGAANQQHMAGAASGSEVHRVDRDLGQERRPYRQTGKPVGRSCKCCGGPHPADRCKFKDATCHHCKKKGHIRPVCRALKNSAQNHLNSDNDLDSETVTNSIPVDQCVNSIYSIQGEQGECYSTFSPYLVEVKIGNTHVNMEVDTGASRSTISEEVYRTKCSRYPLSDSNVVLRSYCGERVPILGCLRVPVQVGESPILQLDLLVVRGKRPALLGRDWLCKIKLKWDTILAIKQESTNTGSKVTHQNPNSDLNSLLNCHDRLFSKADSGIKGFKAALKLKQGATPTFQKARPVPYAIREKVELEYDRLISEDILTPVTHSDWASPTVHVPKPQGKIRVCGDYKRVNDVIEDDGYKLPTIQDLFANLARNSTAPKVYSVIDLAGAFNQLFLDDKSAALLVLNTSKGLLAPKRLCFGVKTAPVLFQATMDKILSGMQNVFCYIDDILIATDTREQHMQTLTELFARLEKFNVRLNRDKCQFLEPCIKYLGHMLTADGIKPLQNKVDAIKNARRPGNISELKSFLGMVNYYGKFVPNLSSKLHPLYELLQHTMEWKWCTKCEEAFTYAKTMLASDHVLVHYDPSKPLVLSVDASPYGLGAVLSHKLEDGSEKPIAYASRTLTVAEKNYAQIDKEGLAIVFGVKKFHLYLYGRDFTLITDHQPLTRIFGPKSGIPPLAAARMQRWALLLSCYQYNFEYRSSARNANADLLSRLPLSTVTPHPDEECVHQVTVDQLPVTAKQIADRTCKDTVLAKVLEHTLSGWPNHSDEEAMKPYFIRRHELTLEDGCILWGRRVVIPDMQRTHILNELHECHPGMTRMKALARSFVWWPGIDQDIEEVVRTCSVCVDTHNTPKQVPLMLWPWATEPWQRIHLDYAEVNKQSFLLVVDSHSKWLESFPMSGTTSNMTITALRSLFARYGFPLQVVSDNGPQFISEEFTSFLKRNSIKHTLCPPYHPASNGLAERHVQTFKRLLEKSDKKLSLQHRVANVLFHYRNTPHTTTGKTPSELFLKRAPRTQLSLVKPCLQRKIELRQTSSKEQSDGLHPKMRVFDLYQSVRVRNMRGGKERWIPGTIVQIKGPLTYLVRVPGNNRRFVHADHLIPDDSRIGISEPEQSEQYPDQPYPMNSENNALPDRLNTPSKYTELPAREDSEIPTSHPIPNSIPPANPDTVLTSQTPVVVTRSGRVSKAPVRFEP